MINGQQMLTALAHCALSRKEIFRRGFITYQRVMSYITQAIDALSNAFRAAQQAAAFTGAGFAGMRDDLIDLRFEQLHGNRCFANLYANSYT